MPNISIKITNLSNIKNAFKKAPILMVENLNKAIAKSIFAIQADSMRNTPVKTGLLRASHKTRFLPLRGELEPTASYALFVHEGTRYMKARPFLLEATESNQHRVEGFLTDAVQDTLDKVGGLT